jgi:hypothetical protein
VKKFRKRQIEEPRDARGRGKEWKEFSGESRKALLPLKKGDGRDFWQGLFKALPCSLFF